MWWDDSWSLLWSPYICLTDFVNELLGAYSFCSSWSFLEASDSFLSLNYAFFFILTFLISFSNFFLRADSSLFDEPSMKDMEFRWLGFDDDLEPEDDEDDYLSFVKLSYFKFYIILNRLLSCPLPKDFWLPNNSRALL